MSIVVAPGSLADALAQYTFAYLVTTNDSGSAHVVAVSATLSEGALHVAELGSTTRANLAVRSQLTLIWPPSSPDGYSLIVDGIGSLSDNTVAVAPTRAVLHRRAPADQHGTGGCADNCRELPTSDAVSTSGVG